MRWGKLLGVGILALALPAPAMAGAESEGAAAAFRLHGTHGYSILALAASNPKTGTGSVVLLVGKRGAGAIYEAPATVTSEGIEAELGGLGRISLRTQPLGAEETTRSACSKKPVRYEAMALVGEIEFNGEQGYTRASATRVKDLVKPFLDLVCAGYGYGVAYGPGLPGAELSARQPGSNLALKVDSDGPGKRVRATATIEETSGPIQIQRSVGCFFGGSSFHYTPDLTTAKLALPSPFAASASFDRSAPVGRRWTGNLTVDFPGRANVRLASAGFGVRLRHAHWSSGPIHR